MAQIVKSLVFLCDGEPILALTSGAHRVDVDALGEIAGGTITKASADDVRSATGYAIGGTPPFGHVTGIRTWIDPALCEWETVWAAAGTPDTCFPLSPAELIAVAQAEEGAFAV